MAARVVPDDQMREENMLLAVANKQCPASEQAWQCESSAISSMRRDRDQAYQGGFLS